MEMLRWQGGPPVEAEAGAEEAGAEVEADAETAELELKVVEVYPTETGRPGVAAVVEY